MDEVAGGTSAGAKPLCEHERLVEVQKQVQFAPAELILSVGALQQRDVLLHLLLGALRAVVAERTREQLPQVAPRRARQPVLLSEARVRHTAPCEKNFKENEPTLGTGLARTGTDTGTPREPPKRLLRGLRGT